jgi:hypothetical protein
MIHSKDLAQHFWGEATNTAYRIMNRVYLRPETNKSQYEIWRRKKPTVSSAYRAFNKRTGTVMESINVIIDDDEVGSPSKG